MSRPRKCRRVEVLPDSTYFKPAGMPLRSLDEVVLSFEEAEAVRLKDLEGLEQGEAAGRMNVSRSTFQRVLASVRGKMADALLHGKAIRIEGGDFEMAWRRLRCSNGHEWDVSSGVVSAVPELCPTCKTAEVAPAGHLGGRHGTGQARQQPAGLSGE